MPPKILLAAGPSENRSTHTALAPNPPPSHPPTPISSTLRVRIHIASWTGTPAPPTSGSSYFTHPLHRSDKFSIQFFFTPHEDVPGDELVISNTFDKPIRERLPVFFGAAWAALRWVDPGIQGEPYADCPEVHSRVLGAVNFLDVRGEVAGREEGVGVEEGAGEGEEREEEAPVIEEHMPADIPGTPAERRKHFLYYHQKEFTFRKGVEYRWDFCNGMMDFSDFSVKIPGLGFKFEMTKYWDQQPLRFVLKNINTGEVYGVVQFDYDQGLGLNDGSVIDGVSLEPGDAVADNG